MSTGNEGKVTGDGGTRCFGADVSTAVTGAPLAFMIVANDGACLDGQSYAYKAIIFADRTAIAVRCITAADATRLKTAQDAGTANVTEPSAGDIAAVSTIITCPPVAPGGGTAEYEADVEERLGELTNWAQPLFDAALAKAAAESSAA
ncbi:MAG: hypothetical protein ACREBE_06775 [bacterium]